MFSFQRPNIGADPGKVNIRKSVTLDTDWNLGETIMLFSSKCICVSSAF